jgi:predicted nucleotidyltransferase
MPPTRPDPTTEDAARRFLQRLSDRQDVAGAILFGSRARRTYRPDSDADVAVLLRGPSGEFLATKLALADIAYDVLLETGVRIQPLPIWEEEWRHPERYPNPRLLENIRREGIVL